MAKTQKYVTRTMKTTIPVIACVDVEAERVIKKSFSLPGVFKDNEAIVKYVSRINPAANPVRVVSVETVEDLRGMTEDDFLKYSVPMVNSYTPFNPNEETEMEG